VSHAKKEKLIEEMRQVRAKNNAQWMALVHLVEQKAPEKAAALMLEINKVDLSINHVASSFRKGQPEENQRLIHQLEALRGINNQNWMDLLRAAFKADEGRAVEIMNHIAGNDAEVNRITAKLKEA